MVNIETSKLTDSIDDTIAALHGVQEAYSNVKEADNIPYAFARVAGRIPLVTDTLTRVQVFIRDGVKDENASHLLESYLDQCMGKAVNLRTVFRKLVSPDNVPRPERYREAVIALGKGARVEELMKGILQDVQSLVENCGEDVEDGSIQAVDGVQVKKLVDAVEEMSELPPSSRADTQGNSVNNYGCGTMNANTGVGTQNNNTGSGKQFIGDRQYFGRED